MPKQATKAADNVFYKARMKAATFNDRLSSREGASEASGIDRTRIVRTELGTLTPYPEEVLVYSELYNAPELCNAYCSRMCPIGKETVEPISVSSLERTCLKLLSSTRMIESVRDGLVDIAEDGIIDEEEKPKMKEILDTLHRIATDISELELTCKKILKE